MASVPTYLLQGVPVVQPAHLEGDPDLATEILPGPPFSMPAQMATHKHDTRKPPTAISYLPTTDPGSTYSMHTAGGLGSQETDGPRRKRVRVEKGRATSRAQRASARNVNGSTIASDMVGFNESEVAPSIPADSDLFALDEPSTSRANSVFGPPEETSLNTNGRTRHAKRDKGKEKEVDTAIVRVKEEPKAISLHSPEPFHPFTGNRNLASANQLNEDHCSACHSQGALVYCDGCPRAFHFWCLDPPMEATDLPEGDSRWFCPSCIIRKDPPPKPTQSFLSPLIHHVQTIIPAEYQLPEDIRTFFKDVATGPRGAYVDGAEIKQPRLNRHGQLEDRDPHRLKDRAAVPVLCFRCGLSAMPGGNTTSTSTEKGPRRSVPKVATTGPWKSIVSCDYCPLHWHLDCLNPPLPNMPPFSKKWMCPNHADQVLHPKRRIPKQGAPPVAITNPKQFNNGNIEVTHAQVVSTSQDSVAVDEILINGRRYKVPERVIMLDFWEKMGKTQIPPTSKEANESTEASSPLTSLSSLEDLEDTIPFHDPPNDIDDFKVAEWLCGLKNWRKAKPPSYTSWTSNQKKMVDKSSQTEPDVLMPDIKKTVKRVSHNKGSQSVFKECSGALIAPLASSSAQSRRKSANNMQIEPIRELRSRSKNNIIPTGLAKSPECRTPESSITNGSETCRPLSSISKANTSVLVKLETREIQCIALNGTNPSDTHPILPSPSLKAPTSKRNRNARGPSNFPLLTSNEETTVRSGGRKRKERDESEMTGKEEKERREEMRMVESEGRREKDRRGEKPTSTASRQNPVASSSAPVTSIRSSLTHVPPTPSSSTPSLKIRLPRLSSLNLSSNFKALRTPNLTFDTPKRP